MKLQWQETFRLLQVQCRGDDVAASKWLLTHVRRRFASGVPITCVKTHDTVDVAVMVFHGTEKIGGSLSTRASFISHEHLT